MPLWKVALRAPSLPMPTSLVATPATDPSSLYSTSPAAKPGKMSTPDQPQPQNTTLLLHTSGLLITGQRIA